MRQPEGPHPVDELARIRRLRLRAPREATGQYYVEGLPQVFRALDAKLRLDLIVYCETLAPTIAQQRIRIARRTGARVLRVTPEQFRSISIAARASGVGAVLRQHWSSIEDADPAAGLCWIGIGATRSPGNLGTLLRTAEAVGAAGVIVLEPLTDPFDERVIRASMGGIFGLRLVRASHEQVANWTSRHGCSVVGMSPHRGVAYTDVSLESPLVILFGEERRGLTQPDLDLCTYAATIPMVGHDDSLNLGVAAGIALFDLRRRRLAESPPPPPHGKIARHRRHRRHSGLPTLAGAATPTGMRSKTSSAPERLDRQCLRAPPVASLRLPEPAPNPVFERSGHRVAPQPSVRVQPSLARSVSRIPLLYANPISHTSSLMQLTRGLGALF